MIIKNRPELSEAEKKLPLAKYYDIPLYGPGPLQQQIIDAGPMDPALALRPENFLDLLQPEGYQKAEYGYCVFPEDGGGYMAVYTTYPGCTPQMLAWYFRWLNLRSKNMPEDQGNLRYKIWCPPDHWTHAFVNGKDKFGGIYSVESLDLGAGERKSEIVRHPIDVRACGLSEEREQALKAAGCFVDCAYQTFDFPGSRLCATISRVAPNGVMEKISREWFGYKIDENNKVVRDESTVGITEEYMKKLLIHCTVEAQHLSTFLPKLYAEYSKLPDDAD